MRQVIITLKSFSFVFKSAPFITMMSGTVLLIRTIIPLALLLISKQLINDLYDNHKSHFHLMGIELPFIAGAIGLIIAYSCMNAISSVINLIQEFIQSILNQKLTHSVTSRILLKVAQFKDLLHFEDPDVANSLQIIQREAIWRPGNLLSFGQTFIGGLIALVASLALLLPFNWTVPLVMIGTAVPALILTQRFSKVDWRIAINQSSERRKIDYIIQVLMNSSFAKEVRLFGTAGYLVSKYNESFSKLLQEIAISRGKYLVVTILSAVITSFGILYGYVWVVLLYSQGKISIGEVTLFTGAVMSAQSGLTRLISGSSGLAKTLDWMRIFFDFLELPSTMNTTGRVRVGLDSGTVQFCNVSFRYKGSVEYALHNVSFTIPLGTKVAIVGENGAGKSTIVKLLMRMYDPDEGAILINGADLRDIDLDWYRSQISAVFQDYAKFNFNVRESVGIGSIHKMDEDLKITDALDQAGLSEIVATFESGIEQQLGKQFPGGIDLSGGQWQRIALARGFLGDGKLVILDEHTSSLDPEAEADFYNRYAMILEGKTSFMVTHRMVAAKLADVVIIIKKGCVVEFGTHEELTKQRGLYYHMWKLQYDRYTS